MDRLAARRRHDRQSAAGVRAVVPGHVKIHESEVRRGDLDDDFDPGGIVTVEQRAGGGVGDGVRVDGRGPCQGAVVDAVAVALQEFEQSVGLGHRQRGARAVAVGDGSHQAAHAGARRHVHPGAGHEFRRDQDGFVRGPAAAFDPFQDGVRRVDAAGFETERDGIDDAPLTVPREHFAVGTGQAWQSRQRRAGGNFLGEFAVGSDPGGFRRFAVADPLAKRPGQRSAAGPGRRKKREGLHGNPEPVQRRERKLHQLTGRQGGAVGVDGLGERGVHPGRVAVTQGCPRKVSAAGAAGKSAPASCPWKAVSFSRRATAPPN